MGKLSRREFIRGALIAGTAAGLPPFINRAAFAQEDGEKKPEKQEEEKKDEFFSTVAVAKDDNPAKSVKKVIDLLGGIKKFVKKGDVVAVKPNIAWDRTPEQAACTNPTVVAAVVALCKKAGAKTVKVFDRSCNNPRLTYDKSGIKAAAEKEGAKVFYVDQRGRTGYKTIKFPQATKLTEWPILEEALDADVLINVPIAKHHGTTKMTLCIKNLMGICGGSRGEIHRSIDEKLADIATLIKPQLNIVDGYRILWASGPQGGNARFVETKKTIIAGTNMTTVDAYSTQLFKGVGNWGDVKPEDIPHIKISGERKLGEIDLSKIEVKK